MSTIVFLAVCALLLLLPFVPAWQEWRHPTDHQPLPVPHDTDNAPGHFARCARAGQLQQDVEFSDGDLCCEEGSMHRAICARGWIAVRAGACILDWAHADGVILLQAGSVGLRRLTAGRAIELGRGCCFERLHAPEVCFGRVPASRQRAELPPAEPREQPWSRVRGAQPARAGCWFFDGDCEVPDGASLQGCAVVAGVLRLGAGSVIHGDVKARNGILLGPGSRIEGAVTCERDIHFLEGAGAAGPVISEQAVFLAEAVRIGTPAALTTLSAATVVAQAGARLHGTAWAHETGVVWGAA